MPHINQIELTAWLTGWVPEKHIKPLLNALDEADAQLTRHGDYQRWSKALAGMPKITPSSFDLGADCVRIGMSEDMTEVERRLLEQALRELHPWRKGPFDFFGVHINTEWRSDWKWNRLKDAIAPLDGRNVLDVGCGSGYHCWRMLADGAAKVIGIDPTHLFAMQFQACQQYIQDDRIQYWPLGIDDIPADMACFDSVFSMGILYHRRSPIDHLLQLKSLLKPGGELILETLVIDGDATSCLIPQGRYAKMRNVWFIPSVPMLENWLRRSGFKNVRTIDVSVTTVNEQRSTDWMRFESLPDYLDSNNPDLTVEGHPAPLRVILSASI
jgi:tRNA (mo5U34)-methyltransferase